MVNPNLLAKLIALQEEFASDAIKNQDATEFRITGTLCCLIGCITHNCMEELATVIEAYNELKIAQLEHAMRKGTGTVH